MSVPRCRFAARSGRLPLACSLGLLLACAAVLLAPALALAFVSTGSDGSLCQSPPPGDPFTSLAFLDPCHGWALGVCPVLLSAGCASEAATGGALTPQSFTWIAVSVDRPPPPSD